MTNERSLLGDYCIVRNAISEPPLIRLILSAVLEVVSRSYSTILVTASHLGPAGVESDRGLGVVVKEHHGVQLVGLGWPGEPGPLVTNERRVLRV